MTLMQDLFIQKKIAFLEGKSEGRGSVFDDDQMEKLAKLSSVGKKEEKIDVQDVASAASDTMGLTSTLSDEQITDKMLAWQPLEESMYHLWVATHGEKSIDEFYTEEQQGATTLSGIVEPYNRPVKNRPGDFILKMDNLPIAFLYSTRVNLEKLVGKKFNLLAAPRPNHHFAFPAYFVLDLE